MSLPSVQEERWRDTLTPASARVALHTVLRTVVGVLTAAAAMLIGTGPAVTAAPMEQAYLSPAARLVPQVIPPSAYLVRLTDHTARSDPDSLLGLPGQYVSKAGFTDSDEVTGYVELFATTSDRLRRENVLRSSSDDSVFVNGRALLRLTNVWRPDGRIDAYGRAMERVVVK